MNISDLRMDYTRGALLESEAGSDPIALFRLWMVEAISAGIPEATP